MELLSQPFNGQLGNRLIELLDSSDYQALHIFVAFARNSGVLRIKDALERFRKGGGKVSVFVGVDLGGTSYEALTALLLHADSLSVVHSERGQTFHPKIYHFVGKDKSLMVVGSHNMTGGGLWTNFESSVAIPLLESSATEVGIQKQIDDYTTMLMSMGDSFRRIETQQDVDALLENGYVFKEVAEQVRRSKSAVPHGAEGRLFGNGVPAELPELATSSEVKESPAPSPSSEPLSVALTGEGRTVWFETRAMTGGSRNILDLSMKSLVEHGDARGTPFDLGGHEFMRGAVEFFGLDPAATSEQKDIILNFGGLDYSGNTILFPLGANANGTWRLQIKGRHPTAGKITEAFKAKGEGYYLQHKIITFTKVQDDYYFMSVFPESELENFKAASCILARNGVAAGARLLGIL